MCGPSPTPAPPTVTSCGYCGRRITMKSCVYVHVYVSVSVCVRAPYVHVCACTCTCACLLTHMEVCGHDTHGPAAHLGGGAGEVTRGRMCMCVCMCTCMCTCLLTYTKVSDQDTQSLAAHVGRGMGGGDSGAWASEAFCMYASPTSLARWPWAPLF